MLMTRTMLLIFYFGGRASLRPEIPERRPPLIRPIWRHRDWHGVTTSRRNPHSLVRDRDRPPATILLVFGCWAPAISVDLNTLEEEDADYYHE